MVRSVEVIRKELKALDETTATLAAEFDQLYQSYLEVLGKAVRQQVVIATYHLCTQVYPDAFLALSVSQREQLQQNIRRLGNKGETWLQQLTDEPETEPQNFDDLSAEQQERISRLTAALEKDIQRLNKLKMLVLKRFQRFQGRTADSQRHRFSSSR